MPSKRNSAQLKSNLTQQISGPVKWTQSMLALKKQGIAQCVEVGNGQVLKGLMKKIDSEFFKVYNTNSVDEIKTIPRPN